MTTGWTEDELRARIETAPAVSGGPPGTRHEAGSPNAAEVAVYDGLVPASARGCAVVLGMTPELRALALRRFERVVSIDHSPAAIRVYRHWVADPEGRETVVEAGWTSLGDVAGRVDAVLGDGVIGNVASLDDAGLLLAAAADALVPRGVFVTRHAMIPDGLRPDDVTHEHLLRAFRAGAIDATEFGFGTRILGHLTCCYDPDTALLDNARLFDEVRDGSERGGFEGGYTDVELAAIERYRYAGRTLLLPERRWAEAVGRAGFTMTRTRLRGRHWYAYYPLYALRRR